ncbi:hypothetical protein FJT64_017439 [Amphibalanus amphitrite]|uniref:Uncharacterized protein n=1 Tax=Amphibalanus amphitrite TaxID=1232801 RepID=A0A6A4XBR3_AMPAM|nr:hypothetical protein FJT64_017439 [Amphibalanus amphitrite]
MRLGSKLTVGSGLFPATVVNVTISGAQRVDIASNAISSLRQLQQLIVTGVGGITVQRDGLRRPRNGAHLRFRIFNADSVVIRRSGFSGWWGINSRVRIENIRHVTVEQYGFSFSSSFLGPTVEFIDVDSLELAPAAIAAPIDTLHMESLHMPACHWASIGSSVQHLVMNQVNVTKTLRRHALIGLTGEGAAGASTSSPSIRLETLRVERSAEPGSLALAECAPVEVPGLYVAPQRPRVCPTERWTRQLVGVSEGIPLDRVQFQIYQQLAATKPCTEDQWQPVTAADVDDSRCADDSVPSVSESPASAAAPGARWPLPLGLALAGALVLALGAAGLLLVRRLRLRASPPTAAPSAEGRRDRSTGGRSARECPQRSDCPAADSSTLHPPEVCDYAEPLRAAPPVDGDYAEIPPPADYASPISAREDAATNFGDYAQIPGSTDYAVPVTFAECKVTTCEDYAEILRPAEVTSAVPATKVMAANSGDYAEIPGLADCAPTAILRTGDAAGYAEIPCSPADGASPASATADLVAGGEGRAPTPPSSDGGPTAAGGSGSVAESVPPPVPPATAERLQMADELTENPMYVSALDVGKNEIESSHSDG